MNEIVAIVQARMGSSRLPGKIVKTILDSPMLVHQMERISRAKKIDTIVVATTIKPEDDQVTALCKEHGWNFYRGSENDLLDRYCRAAREYHAGIIVRLTSDCPLIDPGIVDRTIQVFLDAMPHIDYVSNSLPIPTFPRGLDTEVVGIKALERAWREDKNPGWREHVTPYIERNPEKFRIQGVTHTEDLSHLRWTVDTPEDLEFIRKIYAHFNNNRFSWKDVLDLLKQHPEYVEINRYVQQKTVI